MNTIQKKSTKGSKNSKNNSTNANANTNTSVRDARGRFAKATVEAQDMASEVVRMTPLRTLEDARGMVAAFVELERLQKGGKSAMEAIKVKLIDFAKANPQLMTGKTLRVEADGMAVAVTVSDRTTGGFDDVNADGVEVSFSQRAEVAKRIAKRQPGVVRIVVDPSRLDHNDLSTLSALASVGYHEEKQTVWSVKTAKK